MKFSEVTAIAETCFKKYFPCGYFNAQKSYLGSFTIRTAMTADVTDCASSIRMNDHMLFTLMVHNGFFDADDFDVVEFEIITNSIACKPAVPYMAMSHKKIPVRKFVIKSADGDKKITKKFDSVFKKVYDTLHIEIDNNNLYQQDRINPKYLQKI